MTVFARVTSPELVPLSFAPFNVELPMTRSACEVVDILNPVVVVAKVRSFTEVGYILPSVSVSAGVVPPDDTPETPLLVVTEIAVTKVLEAYANVGNEEEAFAMVRYVVEAYE